MIFKPKHCTICGRTIVPGYLHHCHGEDIQLAQPVLEGKLHESHAEHNMREAMLADKDTFKLAHIEHMDACMGEHEKTCESCSFFIENGMKTRCVTYRNMQETRFMWEKRVEAQG
jgi:hypothetical protein